MEQLALFAKTGQSKGLPKHLLDYRSGLIKPEESDRLLAHFIAHTPWKQTTQKLWDKEYLTPRMTCWYGETDKIAGTLPWTPELQAIREMVELMAGINSILCCSTTTGTVTIRSPGTVTKKASWAASP